VLYLASWKHTRVALVVSGTDEAGLASAVYAGTPTIPPMVRSPYTNLLPDFVVTSATHVKMWGPAGFLCAGWWNEHWEIEPRTSYVRCRI
jgi:hypothetical protein